MNNRKGNSMMACSTCAYPMHPKRGLPKGWEWCPRCGTLKINDLTGTPRVHLPLIVQRVINLLAAPEDQRKWAAVELCVTQSGNEMSDLEKELRAAVARGEFDEQP